MLIIFNNCGKHDNRQFFKLSGTVSKSSFENNRTRTLLSGFAPHTPTKLRNIQKFILIIYYVKINKLIFTLILYRMNLLLLGFLIVISPKETMLTIKITYYANICHSVLSGFFNLIVYCYDVSTINLHVVLLSDQYFYLCIVRHHKITNITDIITIARFSNEKYLTINEGGEAIFLIQL